MRKNILALLVGGWIVAALPVPASAWDYPGHRIVGAIADFVLNTHYPEIYKNKILPLLATRDADGKDLQRTLSQVAVFPDCAKPKNVPYCGRVPSAEEKAYAARNPQHATFHYTDVPIQQQAYVPYSPGTEANDVVHMIQYAVLLLKDKNPRKRTGVDLTKSEALWLLAHLVGDIHQPLHVGSIYFDKQNCATMVDPNDVPGGMANVVSTTGGNLIYLRPPEPGSFAVGPADNLHFFWDGAAVVEAMRVRGLTGSEEAFARSLATTMPPGWHNDGPPESWAAQWATEILPTAREAHTRLAFAVKERKAREPGDIYCTWTTTVDQAYSDWAAKTAAEQLAKAGFRLAALLAATFRD
jgi:hypothetical protein